MPEPIVSAEQIVATGEELERAGQQPVKPWKIFQALGEAGKFDRYRQIWNIHCAQREQKGTVDGKEIPMPEHVTAKIETEAERWQSRMLDILRETIARVNADHAAQLALQQRAHLERINALEAEIGALEEEVSFWRGLQDEDDEEAAAATEADRDQGSIPNCTR